VASVILSEGVRELQRDWPERYGQPVWWVESFVDRQRFEGVSYRAAGWLAIGWTQGFAKRPEGFVHHGQRKEVYVYVAEPRMRRLIHGDGRQPLLNRALLLAQRQSEEQRLAKTVRMKRILASWKPKLPLAGELRMAEGQRVGQELSSFAALFHPAFGRVEPRQWLELYLQELLSRVPGQNRSPISRRLDDPDQMRNLERFLSDYRWDESWMAERHWQLAAQILSDPGLWSSRSAHFLKPTRLGRSGATGAGLFSGASSLVIPVPRARAFGQPALLAAVRPSQSTQRWRHFRIPDPTTFQSQQHLALELLGRLWNGRLFGGQ
jgi:hypothetical protein